MIAPRRALAALAWCIAALFVTASGCASVLDLGDFRDAVSELCICDDTPKFGGNCEQVLAERLEGVSAPTRELWLEFYAENCADDCTNARACYDQEATCIFESSCASSEECCNFVEGGAVACAVPPEGGGQVCLGTN